MSRDSLICKYGFDFYKQRYDLFSMQYGVVRRQYRNIKIIQHICNILLNFQTRFILFTDLLKYLFMLWI